MVESEAGRSVCDARAWYEVGRGRERYAGEGAKEWGWNGLDVTRE